MAGAEVARRYHEATKHTPESVRRSARSLDWGNRPHPFKEYAGLEPLPLPDRLAPVLRWGAGVVRSRGDHHFRTYASAGALYPVEVYAALPGGLHHFHPLELVLRRLRPDDVRGHLALAAAEPALRESGAVLVLTGIMWRTAWKYGERGWRHLWWDAGTMLANLLALAGRAGLEPRALTGFVDAEVNRLVGADGAREAALALLAVGRGAPAPDPGDLPALAHEVKPLSREESRFALAEEVHEASSLRDAAEVLRYRDRDVPPEPAPPLPLEPVLRRRGSHREFSLEPVPREELAAALARAAEPVALDARPEGSLVPVANAVEGLEQGIHRFGPPDRFELVRAGDLRGLAGFLALEQPLGARAAATTFLLADLDAALGRYGARGYRAAQLGAGIRTGRMYAEAYARGWGATASTFYDDEVSRALATKESPMLCVAVGRR